MIFRKILVPLDGSILSEAAVDPALTLAEAAKGDLALLSAFTAQEMVDLAFSSLEPAVLPPGAAPMRERLSVYLDGLRSSRASQGVPIETVVIEGEAADCVVETAVANHADLILMSTHGRSGASRLFLGSVTESVLRRAPCPVLAVRGQPTFRRIIIVVNQIMLSEQALDPGFAIASCFGAQVHLLLVSSDSPINPRPNSERDETASQPQGNETFRHEEAYLEDLKDRYQMAQPVVTAVRGGKRESAILAYAEAQDADLIVLASRGRTGLRRWLFGSVSGKIMRQAPCSVMVIPPQPRVAGW